MSNRFKNKVAVITGAAQGIGKRVAEKMAKEKGVLVLVDRAEIVHEVAESLKKKTEVLSLTADLEKFADCQRVMDEAVKKFGRIDILIKTKDYVYIIEIKTDSTPDEALAQIEEKGYARPFADDPRRVFRIGVNFSTANRRIDGWKVV